MRTPKPLEILVGLALSLPSVFAFRDTSPFFVYSSDDIFPAGSSSSSSIHTLDEFVSATKDVISRCKSDAYILVAQPGIHVSDFKNGKCVPHMKRAMYGDSIDRSQVRFELLYGKPVGSEDGNIIGVFERWAKEKCGAELVEVDASTGAFQRFDDMKPKVVKVDFPEIKSDDERARSKALATVDTFLFSIIDLLPTDKWTLIYTSSPRKVIDTSTAAEDQQSYTDSKVKRSMASLKRGKLAESGDDTVLETGSLFKRYQFFTPAILMGYLSSFFLIIIGYVALNALTSLKVSYGAFEKDPFAKRQ